MKVLHVPFCFYPDPVGGTEVYVEGLSRCLQKRGTQVLICAPAGRNASYNHGELPVRRFAMGTSVALDDLYGEGDLVAAEAFGRILDEERPDLVHLHAFTSAVSLRLVHEAKQRGIAVVFTYHVPSVGCQRGNLLRWGKKVCDGVLRLGTCTRCTLHGLGLPRGVADLVGQTPVALGKRIGQVSRSGGIWTALRMRHLIAQRHAAFRALMEEVGHVVAVSEWVRDLLLRNEVPPEKLTLSRQGVNQASGVENGKLEADKFTRRAKGDAALRMVFLGRLHPAKGVHVVIQAIRRDPALPVTLDVYGMVHGSAGETYLQRLQAIAGADRRIAFRGPVPDGEVIRCLKEYDLLVVPSLWMETGPLVVLEAFAAGVPVLGSKLGGICELVEDEVNGLLVEPDSVETWVRVLRTLCKGTELLARLRAGIRPPRTIDAVAQEMQFLYEKLVK